MIIGVMFCTKCGFEIKDGYKFCPKCGTPAYVEQEGSHNEVKNEETDDVTKVTNDSSDNGVVSTIEEKEVKKTTAEPKKEKIETDSKLKSDYIPNPLIAEELDIEGVKKMAEKGNMVAMLRQAFRYEMGIGCEKDVNKAEELYEKAGGKDVLLVLEHSHINSIIPDPIYDVAIRPTYDENNDSGVTLKVIPFVKDLLLYYAYKVDKDKQLGQYSYEKSIEYKRIFAEGIDKVRSLHPEFFYSYDDNEKNDLDSSKLYETIKNNAQKRYSFKGQI